jgi:hypothetical protein
MLIAHALTHLLGHALECVANRLLNNVLSGSVLQTFLLLVIIFLIALVVFGAAPLPRFLIASL